MLRRCHLISSQPLLVALQLSGFPIIHPHYSFASPTWIPLVQHWDTFWFNIQKALGQPEIGVTTIQSVTTYLSFFSRDTKRDFSSRYFSTTALKCTKIHKHELRGQSTCYQDLLVSLTNALQWSETTHCLPMLRVQDTTHQKIFTENTASEHTHAILTPGQCHSPSSWPGWISQNG